MAATYTVTRTIDTGNTTLTGSKSYTNTGTVTVSGESIADGQTDKLVAFSLDVSACTAFFALSDYAITIETNNGTTPADTVVLAAGVPYEWVSDDDAPFLLTTDVTALYVTNASGSAATLNIVALFDATP